MARKWVGVRPPRVQVYRERAFAKMVAKGLWAVAAQFVGNDVEMQTQLVMAVASEDPQQALVGARCGPRDA